MVATPLRNNDFVLTDDIISVCRRMHGGFKQSRVVERGFLVSRRMEECSKNKELAESTIHHALIDSNILTSAFKFKTHNLQGLPHLRSAKVPSTAYRAGESRCSMSFSGIRGTSRTPKWYSHGPMGWARGFV